MPYPTLTYNSDFLRAYRRGKSYVTPLLVLYVNKNRHAGVRTGITVTKKVGNAVMRSRARRVVRAALREMPPLTGNYDFVFVCRTATTHCKTQDLVPQMRALLTKAGVL